MVATQPFARQRPGVYVAGPYGFTEAGRHYLDELVLPALRDAGLRPLDPWEAGARILSPVLRAEVREPAAVRAACAALGAANEALINEAAAVFALLDGCDLDSGTCAEVGYAAGIGRAVVGLRTDTRPGGDVAEVAVNLQVLHFIESSGGALCGELAEAIERLVSIVGAPAR